MEFRQIQYFIKLSESISISQAAEELHISQQALSKSIINLENELSTKLFTRTNQGIKLTKDGVYLKTKLKSLCIKYEETYREIFDYFQIYQGAVTLGVAHGFFRSISANYLLDFEKLYPSLHIEQIEFPDLDLENYVLADSSHFAFSSKPWHNQGLQYRPLHREKVFFIAHKDHPLAQETEISLHQLKDENFVFFTARYNIHHRTISACKKAGFIPNVIYKSADVSQLVKMTSQKHGILLCVKHVYDESANDNLVCIPISDEALYWELGLIFKNSKMLDRNGKFFINYFLESFKQNESK